ncbi:MULTISPECIES: cytochrome-c oxidase, cbb3-type subunit III [Devosia]|jgi:cytochrome c oxidase cbb3-type subunit III|uniref:Cbb3-type cytochrome c oxidase subunit n=1 Tax=Devosia litorisediminis TaxID=2829817 RepID=A0A942E6D1_9HYPH|nr:MULTISPECIES: cytochrome-c oxidase, cbb3-type subunit III [Devosia]MBS3848297.1 cytochrome-c oxidase, cbb3-type subunit III [Devosia litorisediminis]MCZ4345191.1 cytochrome-c oxidase, cbb3-type subunit III [Devosia neptuniae]|tara:strand:+ start:1198 stop:2079 length:882 start_codon:yes stop_codon:yes gene_type:complete
MAVGERDKISGQMTTGHEWNGIKELNTPVPKILYIVLTIAVCFAVIWTILNPSWPGINGYFRGLLGVDQKAEVAEVVQQAQMDRATWTDRIVSEDYAAIQADPALMTIVRETGNTLFGDNCAACHGTSATGNPGFPNLTQAPTMWGDDPEIIAETIRVGINGSSDDTRYAQMLAFGRDQMLESEDINTVVTYVQALSQPDLAAATDPELLATGATIFAENCAACHGETAKGLTDTGAPNLTDAFWIYGSDRAAIRHSVFAGRAGVMPSWEGRLTPADIKLLTLYVLDLRANAQ